MNEILKELEKENKAPTKNNIREKLGLERVEQNTKMNKEIINNIKADLKYCYEDSYSTKEQYEQEINYITNLQEENQKLVKVIEELEKYIKNKDYWVCEIGYKKYTPYIKVQMILNKLTELKGNDMND